jgi:hypothetical protein
MHNHNHHPNCNFCLLIASKCHEQHSKLLHKCTSKVSVKYSTIYALWPSSVPDLNTHNYYLWGALRDRICVKIPHSLQKQKKKKKKSSVVCSDIFRRWMYCFWIQRLVHRDSPIKQASCKGKMDSKNSQWMQVSYRIAWTWQLQYSQTWCSTLPVQHVLATAE